MRLTRETATWGRWWAWFVVVAVMAGSGLVIGTLRARDIPDRAIGHSPPPAARAVPRSKLVEYTLNGNNGDRATISYLEPDGKVVTAQVDLPWQVHASTNQISVATGIVAQSDGGHLACTIAVDGHQRARQEVTADAAAVTCTAPAA